MGTRSFYHDPTFYVWLPAAHRERRAAGGACRRRSAAPHRRTRRELELLFGRGCRGVRPGRDAPRHQQARLALCGRQHRRVAPRRKPAFVLWGAQFSAHRRRCGPQRLWRVRGFPGKGVLRYRLHPARPADLPHRRAGLRPVHPDRRQPERRLHRIPEADRPQLHPAQMGLWFCPEPLGLQDCRGRARHRPPVPRERAASGHDLPGHRLYAEVRGFYGEQGALPGSGCAECRAEAAGHPAGAHHRCGRAHQPGGPHLHRGAGEGIFLHQSRRHPLCGCRVARQGLFCRFPAPGSARLVRPPLQGADRLRY